MKVENESTVKKMELQKRTSQAAFENLVVFEPFLSEKVMPKSLEPEPE